MSTAAEAAVDNAPAPPPAPSALRHTVSLKRTISRTGSDNSLVDDAVAKQNTQHDCLRYNISFIFEKLHRKREAVGRSLMEQRIKSVLARGKKGVIMIPDTIIYKHGYPLAWYFTSVDGTIKRKKPENVNPNAITHAFEDDDDPLRVVAFFVSTTWDTAVNPTNTMTFMDSRELNRFVHTQNPMSEGFLQRWVPYKGEKHGHKKADTTLHVTWTPFKTLVEQRTNLMPRRNRAPGEDIDKSRLLNIQETKTDVQTLTASNKLHVRVAAVCEQIAAHLYAVTTDKLCVHGLTGYFKLTKGNRLYFLWASSITAEPAPCSLVIDSVGTITGRHSPPVIVPKFHGSIKASLDHKEDVVDLKPPPWHSMSHLWQDWRLIVLLCRHARLREESDLEAVVKLHHAHIHKGAQRPEHDESGPREQGRQASTPSARMQCSALRSLLSDSAAASSLQEQADVLIKGMLDLGLEEVDRDETPERTRHPNTAVTAVTKRSSPQSPRSKSGGSRAQISSPNMHLSPAHRDVFQHLHTQLDTEGGGDVLLLSPPLSPQEPDAGRDTLDHAGVQYSSDSAPGNQQRSGPAGLLASELPPGLTRSGSASTAKWLAAEWEASDGRDIPVTGGEQDTDALGSPQTTSTPRRGTTSTNLQGSQTQLRVSIEPYSSPKEDSPRRQRQDKVAFECADRGDDNTGQASHDHIKQPGGAGSTISRTPSPHTLEKEFSLSAMSDECKQLFRQWQLTGEPALAQRMLLRIEPTYLHVRKWLARQDLLKTKSLALSTTIGIIREHRSGQAQDGTGTSPVEENEGAPHTLGVNAEEQNVVGTLGGSAEEAEEELELMFSPMSFTTVPLRKGTEHTHWIECFADESSPLMRLHQRVSLLFQDMDVTGDGVLSRLELDAGLRDYGYPAVQRDVCFHVMDQSGGGKISYAEFFSFTWLLSEHVHGLDELLNEAYGVAITEDGLRAIMDFLAPRVVLMQRKWRAILRHRHLIDGTVDEKHAEVGCHFGSGLGQDEDSQARGAWLLKLLKQIKADSAATSTGQTDVQRRKLRAEALLVARMHFITLRNADGLRRREAARMAGARWRSRAHETWPASMAHVKEALPQRDACLLFRRCRSERHEDPTFAGKKLWVCETCCRRFNTEAKTVFEAAEARQVAAIRSEIWARIHMLQELLAFFDPKQQGVSDRGQMGTGAVAGTAGDTCTSLPAVAGALKSTSVQMHHNGGMAVINAGGEMQSAAGLSRAVLRRHAALSYPASEVPAPCSPQQYAALTTFSARLGKHGANNADPSKQQPWRPAGKQQWATMPDPPQGYVRAEIPAQGTATQREHEQRAAYLSEVARLRHGKTAASVHADEQGVLTAGKRITGHPPHMAGLTPRVRWFQQQSLAPALAPAQQGAHGSQGEHVRHEGVADQDLQTPRMRARDQDHALATRIARVRDMLSRPWSNSEQVASQIASMVAKFGEKDEEAVRSVHQLLKGRFRDIYCAYASFGAQAVDAWSMSPSTFFRTMLRFGLPEDQVVAAMQAIAPACQDGVLSAQVFAALFAWHNDNDTDQRHQASNMSAHLLAAGTDPLPSPSASVPSAAKPLRLQVGNEASMEAGEVPDTQGPGPETEENAEAETFIQQKLRQVETLLESLRASHPRPALLPPPKRQPQGSLDLRTINDRAWGESVKARGGPTGGHTHRIERTYGVSARRSNVSHHVPNQNPRMPPGVAAAGNRGRSRYQILSMASPETGEDRGERADGQPTVTDLSAEDTDVYNTDATMLSPGKGFDTDTGDA